MTIISNPMPPIRKACNLIYEDLKDKNIPRMASVSSNTIEKVNRLMKLSGYCSKNDFNILISTLEHHYTNNYISYGLEKVNEFLELNFIELRSR